MDTNIIDQGVYVKDKHPEYTQGWKSWYRLRVRAVFVDNERIPCFVFKGVIYPFKPGFHNPIGENMEYDYIAWTTKDKLIIEEHIHLRTKYYRKEQ